MSRSKSFIGTGVLLLVTGLLYMFWASFAPSCGRQATEPLAPSDSFSAPMTPDVQEPEEDPNAPGVPAQDAEPLDESGMPDND